MFLAGVGGVLFARGCAHGAESIEETARRGQLTPAIGGSLLRRVRLMD